MHILPPVERDYVTTRDRKDSQSIISIGVQLNSESRYNLAGLNKVLLENTNFTNAIDDFIKDLQESDKATNQETDIEFEPSVTAVITKPTEGPSEREDSYSFKVKRLWQAVLNTETETLPQITATDSIVWQSEDKVYAPYHGEVSPLD